MKLVIHYLLFSAVHLIRAFKEQLKVAKVSPFLKHGNIGEIGNYRPISVIRIFSKILGRIMYMMKFDIIRKRVHSL